MHTLSIGVDEAMLLGGLRRTFETCQVWLFLYSA